MSTSQTELQLHHPRGRRSPGLVRRRPGTRNRADDMNAQDIVESRQRAAGDHFSMIKNGLVLSLKWKKKKKSYKPQIIYIIGTDGFSVAKSPFYYGNSQLTFYPLRARATAKPSSRDISQWQSSFLVGTFFLAEEELTGFHRIAASFCFTFFFFLDDSFKNTIIMVSSGWYSVRRPRAGARVVPRGECREGGGHWRPVGLSASVGRARLQSFYYQYFLYLCVDMASLWPFSLLLNKT